MRPLTMQHGHELARISEDARASQERAAELLAELSQAPRDGSGLLALFAAIASPDCAWREGELAVELFEEPEGTRVRVLAELGGGLREAILAPARVGLPLSGLLEGAARAPELLGELHLERISSRCVLLRTHGDWSTATDFDISETSLSVRPPQTADELDEGWA